MDYFSSILGSAWGVLLAVVFFGFTIFIHELGHFLAAKKRGLKVERFSIGFGPRVWGWTGKDGVDYRISLIPLGGYVALPQMADMSAVEGETEDDAEKLPKIGYADKMIVAVMGATFNVIFACVLAVLLWACGGRPVFFDEGRPVIGYIQTDVTDATGKKVEAPALHSKLEPGDKVVSVDDKPVKTFEDIRVAIAYGEKKDADDKPLSTLVIERNGAILPEPVRINPVRVDMSGAGDIFRAIGVSGATDVYISVSEKSVSPASRAGLKSGDRVISINGTETLCFEQLIDQLAAVGDRPATIVVERGKWNGPKERLTLKVVPEVLPYTRPLLALDFSEGETKRHVEFVPVSDDIEVSLEKALKSARTRLMVRKGPPAESSFAESLATGTVLERVDVTGGKAVRPAGDVGAVLATVKDSAGKAITLYLAGDRGSRTATPDGAVFSEVPAKTKSFIGIAPQLSPVQEKKTPWAYVGDTFASTFGTLKSLVSPKSDVSVKHLTGVIGISRIIYRVSDHIMGVVWITLVLNINLAVMNLLPLPVLDGGHMVYATLEKIRGRALPRRIVEYIQTTFVVLLFGLMGFILWRDMSRIRAGNDESRQESIENFVGAEREFTKPVTPGVPAAVAAPAVK